MKDYNPKDIEAKWQAEWEKSGIYNAKDKGKKYYSLIEFPYPSGDGLHVGHPRPYIGMDIISRKRRMEGYDVLYPIGWDAFGLPTENYALKTGKDPRIVTKENSENFKRQIKSLGISFDWSREINTTDPKYYKWTQWLFLKFLEKGLAYKTKMPINWCPKDKIGLANEEVVDGKCERCGTEVELREREQWMLKITAYAERLLKDLDDVDYPERVKAQQRNWIGKSEGALIKFDDIEVFTTRPDTIYGATFIVVSGKEDRFTGRYVTNPATKEKIPVWEAEYVLSDYGTGAIMAVPAHDERDFEFATKHNLPIKYVIAPYFLDETENSKLRAGVESKTRHIAVGIVKHWSEDKYLMLDWKNGWTGFITGGMEEGEDLAETIVREIKEETGYKNIKFIKHLGGPTISDFYAPHKNLNQHAWGYGMYLELIDGDREEVSDTEHAKHDVVWKAENEVLDFLQKGSPMGDARYSKLVWERLQTGNYVWNKEGVLINSEKFDGLESEEAKQKITKAVKGEWVTKFKLRDWVFSRQRYWGEPIPVIHCKKCGTVPVPESDLPVELPVVEKYEPTETGDSPLAKIESWVNVRCPLCGDMAKRETDVMPNWAGSSWYFMRYADPENDKEFASKKALKNWMPVDWYNGGMEHTTLHLLYSRFWNKFLFDLKLVPTSEPYKKRTSHGLILAEGGEKMSKSKGNVVNPDDIVKSFGADTLRLYEMFMGPFEQAIAWSESSLVGPRRFIERVWKLMSKIGEVEANNFLTHSTIKKVSEDIESMGFNTAVSAMMVWVNELDKREKISEAEYKTLLQLLAPFAPHITEELWAELGQKESIHQSEWPKFEDKYLVRDEVKIMVQVDGRVRGSFMAKADIGEKEAQEVAQGLPEIEKWVAGKTLKFIFVPQKLVNIVTS